MGMVHDDERLPGPRTAAAYVRGGPSAPALRGEVFFRDTPVGVWVQADFTGFPDEGVSRFHGFHIHETGDCAPGAAGDFSAAGGHYDPGGAPHPAHAGDMPPLLSTRGGAARMCFVTDRFTVADILNRSVVVHAAPDDFKTQPGGASGARWGCGVVREI
jgi:Cu-Zn family superoxide dismutase